MKITLCPNCFEDLKENQLGWLCRRESRPSTAQDGLTEEVAKPLAAIFGAQADGKAKFQPVRRFSICGAYNAPTNESNGLVCASCEAPRKQFKWACPHCRQELPDMTGFNAGTLTVAGATGAGKTYFIVALHDWAEHNFPRFDLDLIDAMGESPLALFRAYQDVVFNSPDGMLPPTTPGFMHSFTWKIRPSQGEGYVLSLPDVAGEEQLTVDGLQSTRILFNCAGVILLLDGERLTKSFGLRHQGSRSPQDHMRLLNAMLRNLEDRLSKDEVKNLPFAVCVNKIDFLSRKDDARWNKLLTEHPVNHDHRFDYGAANRRNAEIKEILCHYDDTRAIVEKIENRFAHHMFFATATLGGDEGKHYHPVSVGDPLLWHLWHWSLIP